MNYHAPSVEGLCNNMLLNSNEVTLKGFCLYLLSNYRLKIRCDKKVTDSYISSHQPVLVSAGALFLMRATRLRSNLSKRYLYFRSHPHLSGIKY